MGNRAELKATLALDTTKFQRSMTRAKAAMSALKDAAKRVGAGLADIGRVAKRAGVALTAFSAVMAVGIKRAVDLGGRL